MLIYKVKWNHELCISDKGSGTRKPVGNCLWVGFLAVDMAVGNRKRSVRVRFD